MREPAVMKYVGFVVEGAPHPFGRITRTVENESGEAEVVVAGTAGLQPVNYRDTQRSDRPVIELEEVQSAWTEAQGFVGMVNLMEACPSCLAGSNPASIATGADYEDRLDWGDSDLRNEAEQAALADGYWKAEDGEWFPDLSVEQCRRCGGWPEDADGYSEQLVPALPLDVQPAEWLQELLLEVVARLDQARELPAEERLQWEITAKVLSSVLAELPRLPPEAWWPANMLRSEADAVVIVRRCLEVSAQRPSPERIMEWNDDVPF